MIKVSSSFQLSVTLFCASIL